jgi:two-component system CheB/CheR fusion protein
VKAWENDPTGAEAKATTSLRSDACAETRSGLGRVLARFLPAHILIDANQDVVQIQGNAGRYLELAPGRANMRLLSMLRPGLSGPLRTALRAATRRGAAMRKHNVRVETNTGLEHVDIEVAPLNDPGHTDWFVVIFEAIDEALLLRRKAHAGETPGRKASSRLRPETLRLRGELAQLRESLRIAVREQEVTSGELAAANEEVKAANEELQSIIEELETSREQLQSSNDELSRINETLLQRAAELTSINGDLNSLLASIHVTAMVVATDMRIRCFTAAAEETFNLIRGDVGRPLKDLNLGVPCPDLDAQLRQVMVSGQPMKFGVEGKNGNRYSMRLRPYVNEEGGIEGVAIVTDAID